MKRRREQPEAIIQRAVCQHLRQRGAKGLVWFAVPNGGARRPVEASILKGLGVRAGVSDIIALHGGKFFAVELKAPKGRPTESQLEFVSDVNRAGGYAVVAEGLNEAIRCLESWGLLRGKAQATTQTVNEAKTKPIRPPIRPPIRLTENDY